MVLPFHHLAVFRDDRNSVETWNDVAAYARKATWACIRRLQVASAFRWARTWRYAVRRARLARAA